MSPRTALVTLVALRGSGAVAMIDLAKGEVLKRTNICTAPRGVAYDTQLKQVHVACATGELVSLDSSSNAVVRTLRPIATCATSSFAVTTFSSPASARRRSWSSTRRARCWNRADPAVARRQGRLRRQLRRRRSRPRIRARHRPAERRCGRRASAFPTARSLTQPARRRLRRGDPCGDGTIVNTTISTVDADGNVINGSLPSATIHGATVAVDVATDGNGAFAVASAGTDSIFFTTATQLEQGPFGCGGEGEGEADPGGQPVAVSFWNSQWVAQTREPAALALIQNGQVTRIELPGESVADTGHVLSTTRGQRQHGARVRVPPPRRRRGQSHLVLRHHRRAPHADGRRRRPRHGAPPLGRRHGRPRHHHARGLREPHGRLAAGPASHLRLRGLDPDHPRAALLGAGPGGADRARQEIFFRTDVGCADCHNGGHFTNNRNADVGTGRSVQVPTLTGVATRAPFMHDGCAATLHDRFDPNQAAQRR